jgi:uncharacterized protein
VIDIGVIEAIYVYPVKSFAGVSLPEVKVGWHGVADDRRFAFQKLEDTSGLPWLSAREVPRLLLYRASAADPAAGNGASSFVVARPDGNSVPLDAPELLDEIAREARQPLKLTHVWRGTFDSMPLSIISTDSIAAVEKLSGRALEPERFRPNLVVRTDGSRPFPEDKWVSSALVIGDGRERLMVRINRKDPRCRIVNFDPETAAEDSQVLARIVQDRKNQLGVYASIEFPATVRVGDPVRLRD